MKLCLSITVVLSFLVAGEPSVLFLSWSHIKIRLTHVPTRNTYAWVKVGGKLHGGRRVVQLTKCMNLYGDTTLHCD